MNNPKPDAKKFLADSDDDTFDFQEWYDAQLDDFRADQENVPDEADRDVDQKQS